MGQIVTVGFGKEKLQLRLNENLHLFKDAWVCKRHSNADFELHIILKGSCDLEVDDRSFSMEAGRAVIIAPGAYHLPTPQKGPFERFTMSFALEAGAVMERLRQTEVFSVTKEMDRLCRDIFRETAGTSPYRREMLQALTTQLMICTLRTLGIQAPSAAPTTRAGREVIQQLDDFFELHMADDVGAEVLAEQLHLSRRQLARILQKTYGMGFREKRIRARMDHAAWLLHSTADSVNQIAEAVGYASETAFYQAFRDYFGQTPGQYRRTKR